MFDATLFQSSVLCIDEVVLESACGSDGESVSGVEKWTRFGMRLSVDQEDGVARSTVGVGGAPSRCEQTYGLSGTENVAVDNSSELQGECDERVT